MLITLAVGFVPTIIAFLFDWYWGGTIFALLTLLIAITAAPKKLYPALFTLYAVISMTWVSASVLDGLLAERWDIGNGMRITLQVIAGVLLGLTVPAVFWFSIFATSTKFILTLSKSADISFWKALKYVAAVTFDITQPFVKVENGKIAFENTKGMISNLGGPGILIVAPGNAAVLECSGKITRIVGPGFHRMQRFEYFWQPVETKGIVDLRPQFRGGSAEDVRTKDGIPLKIKVGTFFQIEPKHITDQRPESHFAGGDATSKVIGAPEFPVYEAIIKKSLFNVPEGGWKDGWFPSDPIHRLRDIVATYTLDQIFSLDRKDLEFTADERIVRAIEQQVQEAFAPINGGVWFKGLDIREITMPPEVEAQVLQDWTSRAERERKVLEAEAERDAIIALSEGQADALQRTESVKLRARRAMGRIIGNMIEDLQNVNSQPVAMSFISVVQELSNRVGQDETVAMRYIEAMRAIIQSEGPKSFVITPPTQAPGFMPSPPAPSVQPGKVIEERLKSDEDQR